MSGSRKSEQRGCGSKADSAYKNAQSAPQRLRAVRNRVHALPPSAWRRNDFNATTPYCSATPGIPRDTRENTQQDTHHPRAHPTPRHAPVGALPPPRLEAQRPEECGLLLVPARNLKMNFGVNFGLNFGLNFGVNFGLNFGVNFEISRVSRPTPKK